MGSSWKLTVAIGPLSSQIKYVHGDPVLIASSFSSWQTLTVVKSESDFISLYTLLRYI